MLRLTLAQVRAHVGRLVASCLGIIIAVAFIVATLVLTETSRITVLEAVGARYVDTAAVVTPTGSAQTPESNQQEATPGNAAQTSELVDALTRVTGVTAVSAETQSLVDVEVPGSSGTQFAVVESVPSAAELQWHELASGRLPTTPGEVAVSARVGAALGDTLRVTAYGVEAQQPGTTAEPEPVVEDVIVVGVVDLGSDPTANVQGRLFATPDQVAAWGGVEPFEFRIAAAAGADLERLLVEITGAVRERGSSAAVVTGEQAAELRTQAFTGEAAALTAILLVFAGIAVLVAGMVIANTFAVLLAQRIRELALLRCVGASARQVRRGVMSEAAITGFGASAVGVGAGICIAALTSTIIGQSQSAIPLTGLSAPPSALLLGLATGTVVTVGAAFFPARSATRVAPLAALRPSDLAPIRSKGGLLNLALGLGLFVTGVALLTGGVLIGDVLVAVGGGALSALGILLLLQRIIPPVVALAGRAAARFGGVPASLAAGNATRNPRRTAA
ncbi:MAG: ABC transporter permease, partial [Geodermatophilaceae bacterium]|nr:ABC transporter permease [Geodermatophilaceae bacterium]